MAPLASPAAYLDRIALGGNDDPDLAAVHRAHVTSIAFENLDSSNGIAPSLEPADLEHKMVHGGRGGYCFEHNLLLAGALESLGGRAVAPLLARVRMGPQDAPRPLNHLLLRVTERDGAHWLADVGFGGGGLLEPLPFAVGAEADQSGWRYRITEDGPEWVLQCFQDDAWTDMYGFVPEPVPHVDVVVHNWYTATHPDSPFVTGFMAGRRAPDRCLSLFRDDQAVLVERPVGGASQTTVVPDAVLPSLLAERFGIPGVAWGADGRLTLGAGASGRDRAGQAKSASAGRATM